MDPKALELLSHFFSGLLGVLGEKGEVELRSEEEGVYVNLQGQFQALPEDDPLFRLALGHIASLHLRSRLGLEAKVVVDINGQEAAQQERIAAQARALAEEVRAGGKTIQMEPMPARERRIVHLALADFPGVRTYSVGKGEARRVVIEPA